MVESLKILMGLLFFPRGGSAQVVRYLSRALVDLGHQVHIATGSLRDGNPEHDARLFFGHLPLTTADYTDAWQGHERALPPISNAWEVPLHPSYEDKPGVPDAVFYRVDPQAYDALEHSWIRVLHNVGQRFRPDVLHLHHLSHMNLAAMKVWPEVPKTAQLHGTELKMLEGMATVAGGSKEGGIWVDFWREKLTRAAHGMDHFFAISTDVNEKARRQLLIEDCRVTTIFNGVDVSLFRPQDWPAERKISFLRKILLEEPQGWSETGGPGSISYTEDDLENLLFPSGQPKPLLMFVGRFLGFKRVPVLLRAVHEVNRMFETDRGAPPFNLLVWGGMPGEWEDEHPHTLALELGLPNVFFAGWLPHDILSQGFNLADLFVAPSDHEPFGQVFLEAMATRIPVIATRSGGPLNFVVDTGAEANGWFCEVDDVESLAATIHRALSDEAERRRRGQNALALIRESYDWSRIARRYAEVYTRLVSAQNP